VRVSRSDARIAWIDTRAIPLAAAAVRFLAACTIAYAVFTALILIVGWYFSYDESKEAPVAGSLGSWARYDRLLREELAARMYAHAEGTPEHALWSSVQEELPRLAPPETVAAASAEDRARLPVSVVLARMMEKNSDYEWAREGALDCVLPLLLGLALVLFGAAAAGYATALGPLARGAIAVVLVVIPCAIAVDPRAFYAVDQSYTSLLAQAVFVAGFAATTARISARAIAERPRGALFLASVKSSPAPYFSARARAIEAARQLNALVPIVVTAAVFTRARAVMLGSTDASQIAHNGLGDLMSSVIQATSARARLESAAVLMIAVGFLTFIGHRLLRELVRGLSPLERGGGPAP
jgi:hypothetical protein